VREDMTSWATSSAGRVVFGRGAAQRTGTIAARLGTRAFVCTDSVLMSAGVLDPVLAALRDSQVEVVLFEGGEPEVARLTVEGAAEVARTANPDLIIGVGGGSNMDLAKGVALLLAHRGELSDYYGESLVPGPTLPVIAVPTTSGTGSEVSPVAVFGDERRRLKAGVSSTHLLPVWSVVDPELTLSCPPSVTAHSGMDALSHAIEAMCAVDYRSFETDLALSRIFSGKNGYSDALATKAITLIGRSLRQAVADGSDLEAREDMMMASLLAGMSFGTAGTGLVHALQYPVGALTHTPHGLGNALLMPAVMRYNESARTAEMALIYRLLDTGAKPDTDDQAAAAEAPAAVAQLAADLGIAGGLQGIGITESDIPAIAADAITIERLVRLNPRSVTVDDLQSILIDALIPATETTRHE
jgi:alcohol dehydrogenase class IV